MDTLTQHRLIRRAQRGDQDAFATLMTDMAEYLTKTAYLYLADTHDVQDAISAATLAAFQALPQLKQPRHWRTWITRILIRQCYVRYKVKAHEIYAQEHLPEPPADRGQLTTEEKMDLLAGLREINQAHALTLMMFYYHGLSIKEISALQDTPANTVKSNLRRGRQALRDWLGEDYL
ncbi:sigma-70 family RNA polymerase sigma factor [Schleiferilactobacillus perolens]|uniref:sigma-70 family RNA polymerase sigma factor n=1 Tax=Schleiferilactobacillus perolens TaxID=100468 RepID=UPI0023546EFD|nr:sigma-70 family RNA polymerase sigma factor [Schleiferilactobacillus perolens]MCI2171009.1 sigma-70 family RNA polymerase sigma factor [Schleiferilactobacillus perolens]